MIFLWIRSSHSVLVLVREDSPSCLDVFFSAAGRSGEGCNYHFILLPHHLFNITLLGKMFSFSQQIFSCFSYDLSHHTPYPLAEPTAGLFNWLHAGFPFILFSLLNSLPTILLQVSYQVFCLTAIHSSMWSLPVHACNSANICSHSAMW